MTDINYETPLQNMDANAVDDWLSNCFIASTDVHMQLQFYTYKYPVCKHIRNILQVKRLNV